MRKYKLWIGMSVVLFLATGCQALVPPNEPITWAWSYRAGDYIRSQPTVDGEVVYIGADDNRMHAVDINRGDVLWTYETADNVTSSAATDDDWVYFGSWDGTIYALDGTGEPQWTFQTGDWVSATPLLNDGVLYVGSHDRTFYALDANTGALIWRYAINGRVEDGAIVAGDLILFNSSDGYVHAIDPDDGQRRWYYYMGSAADSAPSLSDGQIYVATLDRTLHALDSSRGDLLWTYRASAPIGTTPVVDGNAVYIGDDEGIITALAADSGAPVWQQGLGEMIRSTPAVWNGLLFVGTNDGNLFALDTRSGVPVWRYRLGGTVAEGPTISDDRLYIGSTTSQLQAFDLDLEQLSHLLDVRASVPAQLPPLEPKAVATFHADHSVQIPSVIEYHRLWRADAAMPDIDANRALRDVIAFRPQSPAAHFAHVSLARYYAQQEDPAAVDHYRAALALDGSVALHSELAYFLEAQGDGPAAYEEYRSVLGENPDAFEGMRRTGSDPLQVAADLNKALYYTDALETVRDVDDPEAVPLRAEAYLGLGRYAEAATAYRSMIRSDPANESARMGLALAQAWLGDGEAALDLYSTIDSVESQRRQAQLLASDDPEQALDLYLEANVPSAWWSATALLESQDRLTETLPIYEYLAESDSQYADDAAYRLIVLGQRLNNTEAIAEGQRLLEQQGLNWLALRNRADALEVETLPTQALDKSLMRKVDALDALGRSDLAELELIYAARFSNRPEVILAMADALSQRGRVMESQRIAERYIATSKLAPLEFWALSYPRPYASLVMDAAAEFDVDPLLIWAVMREESRFDPDALSHAGARGLMQVIPSTQSWIAEELGETQAPGDAYIPAASIRMGAWLLDFLSRYFDGDLELAIPAYNAGAGSVESWQSDPRVASRDDLLRWIGYNETRLYLKRVALSYQVYRALYGSE